VPFAGKRLSVFEHQVGRVFPIVDGEGWVQSDLVGIFAKQPRTDTVEGADPAQRIGHDAGTGAKNLACDPLDPFRHLGRCAPRKRHQQDPAGVGAADDQMGDAVSEGVRLAGSGAGDDQQRRPDMSTGGDPVLDRTTLLRIKRLKV
jgi:hypothetical protein